METTMPIHQRMPKSCFLVSILLYFATRCHSWNAHVPSRFHHGHPSLQHRCRNSAVVSQACQKQQRGDVTEPEIPTSTTRTAPPGITRRSIVCQSLLAVSLGLPKACRATAPNGNGIVTVRLESPQESLGIEIYDTRLRGNTVVAIRRIVVPNRKNQVLLPGMIVRPRDGGSLTAQEFFQKLSRGPYPLEVDFLNLAAAGDAISDLGSSIVSPQDALELAQKTEDSSNSSRSNGNGNLAPPKEGGFGITTLQQTQQACAIRSRRNDVLEIEYEASYITGDGSDRKVLYDASAFRGTGFPYQMVLGSGDVIPGVDQGLYDMCPGDKRRLTIPPVLGHGPNSRRLYKIPDNYKGLEWEVGLVTIDTTIREDNNNVSREDRESRFAY